MIRALVSLLLPTLAAMLTLLSTAEAQTLSLPAQLGRQMFFDTRLSGSGRMACASCHDPANHYAPANDLRVQLGGPRLNRPGARAVPTLTYKNYTPAYADLADNPDGISPPGPGGGFTWDGRAGTLAEQAKIPLLSPVEMANRSVADVVRKLKAAPYAPLFVQAFGRHAFDKPALAFARAMDALQAFQLEDPSFHPYSSKYDLYAGNKVGGELTPAEARGLAVFQDPQRGNCAACHYSGAGVGGSVAQFTDYSYAAIGVPNRPGAAPDLGLCGRQDHPKAPALCGMFKTPTLRNVATRKAFFHNGAFASLEQALRFYATRDTEPQRWYPAVRGKLRKFDGLPAKYHGNIDAQMPLDGRAAGSTPPLNEQDIQDLLAFLNTLTDGYVPPPQPATAEALAPPLQRFLAEHGEICIARQHWPVDVSARDVAARTRNALQMPVLEQQGLVGAREGFVVYRDEGGVEEQVPTRRYELTEAGRRFYAKSPRGDLCAGQLSLDAIVAVQAPAGGDHARVSYRYRFEAAPWVLAEPVRRVFPLLDAMLRGQGSADMQQGFHRDGAGRWVADATLDPDAAR